MNNFNKPHSGFGVDFDHLGLYPLNVSLSTFRNYGDTSTFLVRNLAFRDKSGFVVDTLNTRVKITPTSLTLTPLNLRTPYTELNSPYLSFGYSDFDDFDDFEEKVLLNTYLARTRLNLGDLSYFVHELKGSRQELFLNGKLNGTVNDFETENLTVAYSPHTMIRGDFKVRDITHIDRAYFDMNIRKLEADPNELRIFQVPPYDGSSYLDLPAEVYRLGQVEYTGTFKGTLQNFDSRGELVSASGNVNADVQYRQVAGRKNYVMTGRVVTHDFDVGRVIDESSIGKVSGEFDAKVSGTDFGNHMEVKLNSNVETLVFNHYAYHNTSIEGEIKNKTFAGKINIKDEHAHIAYNGYFNYGKKVPEYKFTADITNAYITRLNFGNRDESALLSMKLTADARGIKPDDLRGRIDITRLDFVEHGKHYTTDSISLKAEQLTDSTRRIVLNSEIADVEISEQFNFEALPSVFKYILSKAVPSLFDNQVVQIKSREVFKYSVNIKDFTKIQQLFIPDLQLSKNIRISGRFDSDKHAFNLRGRSIAQVKFGDREMKDMRLDATNNGDYLNVKIGAGVFVLNDSIRLENFSLETDALNNEFASRFLWNNKNGNFGNIFTKGLVESHNQFAFTLDTVDVKAQGGLWKAASQALVEIDSTTISVQDLTIKNGEQSIGLDGTISKDPEARMVMELRKFRLESISSILFGSDLSVKGEVNGDVAVAEVYATPNFTNQVRVDSFYVNNDWVGDITADNFYEKGSDRIVTNAKIMRKGLPTLDLTGQYYLEREENNLDYSMRFRQANLNFVNAFLPQDVVKNFQSIATGDIHLTGTPKEPKFNGKLKIKDGAIKIVMLNTSYFLEDGELEITNDMIALNKMTVMDVRGNGGKLVGTYNHENFENGNFDFSLDFSKMLCLNTTEEMNSLYYGKAYASGSINISGYNDNIQMEIDAKTERNTKLTMPMYGVSDVTLGDFWEFEEKDTIDTEKKIDLSGIKLDFDLDVTPDAEITVVFDKLTGQQLKAKGRGPIKMEITPLGDFIMNGVYEIESGSYKLAMQSIVNKNFEVAKGGTIKWYGDPLNAEIDMTAVYKLQASPYPIMPADIQSSYRKNMEVVVDIRLKNSLYRPDFVFDFNVPRGDENVKAAVASVKSTQEELFRQTMALLLVQSFLTPANAVGTSTASSNAAGNYTSELVTNQLNALLSQISKDFDIGVNYKPGDEISDREIALALSTQILNGRINVSTNVGISQSAASAAAANQNNVIGDFNIEYLITEDGNVRARAYNESNSFDITKLQQAPYTQGVGIIYQKEFDNARELKLWQKFLNIFRRSENDVHFDKKTRAQKKEDKKLQQELQDDNGEVPETPEPVFR